jgi:hypothetical protein
MSIQSSMATTTTAMQTVTIITTTTLPVGQKGWLTFVWAVSFFFLFVTLFLI